MPSWTLEEYLSLIPLSLKLPFVNRRNPAVIEESARYGPHPPQYLLFLRPEDESIQREGLVFFVHGGGWRMGSPAQFRFVGQFLAEMGFPTILAGYRLAPAFKFPAQKEDVSAAFREGLKLARKRGVASERVIGAGQSAGAHLVSLLAYDRDDLAQHNLSQKIFAGLVLISGPLDFSVCTQGPAARLIRDLTGSEAIARQADPIRYVRGDESIPVLCIHGEKDPLVPLAASQNFAQAVNRMQDLADVDVVEGAHHSDLVSLFWNETDTTNLLVGWLDEQLEKSR